MTPQSYCNPVKGTKYGHNTGSYYYSGNPAASEYFTDKNYPVGFFDKATSIHDMIVKN